MESTFSKFDASETFNKEAVSQAVNKNAAAHFINFISPINFSSSSILERPTFAAFYEKVPVLTPTQRNTMQQKLSTQRDPLDLLKKQRFRETLTANPFLPHKTPSNRHHSCKYSQVKTPKKPKTNICRACKNGKLKT